MVFACWFAASAWAEGSNSNDNSNAVTKIATTIQDRTIPVDLRFTIQTPKPISRLIL